MRQIKITSGELSATATLQDNATADAIWSALPLSAWGNRWGAEIYFEIPVQMSQVDDARDVLEPGELGYWPMGNAFCIFCGQTPASQGSECRAASPVNPFGKLDRDPKVFDSVPSGTEIRLEQV